MNGLMMNRPLLISSLLDHAAFAFHDQEIVSRTVEGPIHRYTYRQAQARAKQLANALEHLGVNRGDRIGTLAWNTYRHFEIYFGVSGMGAVCHTLNPRLHASQLVYIVNHADDKYLFLDPTFVPLVEAIADQIAPVGVVIMTARDHMPDTRLTNVICYEDLIGDHSDDHVWPELHEDTASSLCYTSGTTGNPKGVLFSHRSTVLHSFAIALPDAMGFCESETFLPVVPLFHANGWGTPYAAAMTGTKLVLPGPALDGKSLTELMNAEGVTLTAGVPTVWLGMLNHWRDQNTSVPTLKMALIGGSAPPRSMLAAFQEEFGVTGRHAWGMTEMSPLGSVSVLKPSMQHASTDERYRAQCMQGRAPFGVDMKIVDEAGVSLPRDGASFGELKVRGPWVCRAYYKDDDSDAFDDDGWFGTGDIATIDEHGCMNITDRTKDLVKSGGEWISSIQLENLAMEHPAVAQAAVIGIPHEKWTERPLLIVVPKPDHTPSKGDVLKFFKGKIADWWIPDDVVFEESLPLGGTGKVQKARLRERFQAPSKQA